MLRIHCPYCGVRDHEEFSYFGDATKAYPPLDPGHHDAWVDTVYLRDNPKGEHAEFWQHTVACRRWLVVRRNTVTHEILSVVPARERTLP
ncbi:MAG: sarcosine oxidase subunit delta [Rhodoferax sp.]|nr:sarcosine oxidase subunit delta [Rhodoferax sp.]